MRSFLLIKYKMLLFLPVILLNLQSNVALMHEFLSNSVYDDDDEIIYQICSYDFKTPRLAKLSDYPKKAYAFPLLPASIINVEAPTPIADSQQSLPLHLTPNCRSLATSPNKASPSQIFTKL